MPRSKVPPAAAEEESDYTPEQHLVAAVAEFKKLESANQSYMERMYTTLSSPFKISAKPCESYRLEVLRCYEKLFDRKVDEGARGEPASPPSPPPTMDSIWRLPLHHCHAAAKEYEQCVESRTLAEHLALASSFEARRIAAQARAVEEMNTGQRAGASLNTAE